jgi:putative DNA methylase
LSDFFYVWLKRTAGHLYPEWFAAQLTDKDAEAVANPARFAGLGRKKKALAEQDYERKMEAAFREMHRVLADDGVLTVMFTHKRVEAWDTLASALINAGFSVQASWPVHTESEHSLHQAKKNAAQSTILLACRKRQTLQVSEASEVWWDDIAPQVRYVAREKAAEFAERSIGGVDLYLSTFGPVLAVISEHWPVLTSEVDEHTGQPKPLRPETALDLARQEVIALRKRGLLLGREIQFDEVTDWYLMAWDAFRAEQFPADEARKLAIALGLDVERDLVAWRVVGKKGSDVILLQPKNRRVRGKVDPEADHFDTWLDAAHTAMLVYDEDGAMACEAFLKRAGLMTDSTFKACLQAMINAIPRTKVKGKFVRPEADLLDKLRSAFFEKLEVPAEAEPVERAQQLGLFDR